MVELSPGAPRRYVPEGGERKHREKIHRESKFADDHKGLPFSFSRPPKSKKQLWFRCVGCGHEMLASKNTIMIVCSNCDKAVKVEKIDE